MIFAHNKAFNATHVINILAIGYAFVVPLSRAGIAFFTILLSLFWLLEGDLKQKVTFLLHNRVIRALLAFVLFGMVSLLWTQHPYEALKYMGKYWYFLPLFVFATSLQKRYLSKVLSAFIFGMFVSEIISYGVFFELWHFKHATVENPSPFMHHIEYSVFLAFTALVLLSRIFNTKEQLHKFFYTLFFVTVSGNLFLNAGRTGQFAFIVGVFVLALMSFKNRIKAMFVFVVLAATMLGMAFTFSQTFHDRIITGKENIINVIEKKDYCTSWGGRVGSWIVSTDIIRENPLLGVGIIDNMKVFHRIIDYHYPKMRCMHKSFMHTHNQFLEIATQMGLVGLLFFIYLFYTMARLPIVERQYKNIQYTYVALLGFAFIPEVLFHRQFSMALFALITGLILAVYRIENEV